MLIREAVTADVETVSAMRVEFLADHRGVSVDTFEDELVAATRVFVADGQRSGRLVSWLAEEGNECVGVVSLLLTEMPPRPDDTRTGEGYVLNMFVWPRARGRGIGSALFDECVAASSRLRLRRVVLHATDDGRAMYQRAGFRTNDDWMELRLPP